jgi:hypothetical protein
MVALSAMSAVSAAAEHNAKGPPAASMTTMIRNAAYWKDLRMFINSASTMPEASRHRIAGTSFAAQQV